MFVVKTILSLYLKDKRYENVPILFIDKSGSITTKQKFKNAKEAIENGKYNNYVIDRLESGKTVIQIRVHK